MFCFFEIRLFIDLKGIARCGRVEVLFFDKAK
jgi:hypothetical protein